MFVVHMESVFEIISYYTTTFKSLTELWAFFKRKAKVEADVFTLETVKNLTRLETVH